VFLSWSLESGQLGIESSLDDFLSKDFMKDGTARPRCGGGSSEWCKEVEPELLWKGQLKPTVGMLLIKKDD